MHTSSAPRRASKSALEFGAGVDRLAVRDDHVLEGQLQQRAQRRQRSFLIRWRFPDAQLAARRCQRVGKNDGPLLWQPQRRLVAAPTIVKCNDASRKLAARLDELQLSVGHVPAKGQARPESASVVAANEQVDIANVIRLENDGCCWRARVETPPDRGVVSRSQRVWNQRLAAR